MIEFTDEEKKEMQSVQELLKGEDQESKLLAKALILSSSWYKKLKPIRLYISGSDFPLHPVPVLLKENHFRLCQILIDQLLQKDLSNLYTETSVRFDENELKELGRYALYFVNSSRFYLTEEEIEKVRSTSWHKKLDYPKLYICHKGLMLPASQVYTTDNSFYRLASVTYGFIKEKGKITLYKDIL